MVADASAIETTETAPDQSQRFKGKPIRAVVNAVSRFIFARWVQTLFFVTCLGIALLNGWSQRIAPQPEGERDCWHQAILGDGEVECKAQLGRLVGSINASSADTCHPSGRNRGVLCAWDEPGAPRLFLWADNILVDIYTLFFIGCAVTTYHTVRLTHRKKKNVLKAIFVASVGSFIVGGLIDHAENFWLLAHIGMNPRVVTDAATALSTSKFQFFFANLVIAFAWVTYGAWRRRTPYAFLFRWPTPSCDTKSKLHFDASTAKFEVANVALAHPLYPQDLAGLLGALRDSEIACEQQDDWIVARASNHLLSNECVALISVRDLGCKKAKVSFGTFHDERQVDGLRVRMVLSTVRTAFRLGFEQLQLDGQPEDDKYGPNAILHGTRRLIGMGWDAVLGAAEIAALPSGLRHLRTLGELLRHPDGQEWWSQVARAPTFTFDLRPGAMSMEIMDQLVRRRGIRLSA